MRFALLSVLLLAAPKEPDVEVPAEFWVKLPPPKDGEWRAVYREPGQTLLEYQESGPVRPTAERRVVCLQPCLTRPPADPQVLERLAAFLAAHFGRETRTLEPIALPRKAYDAARGRFDVQRLVPRLRRALPQDALFLLAVTDRDLSLPRMSNVYGWGSFKLRVGIVSLYHLDQENDPVLRRRRTLAVAAHEAGHCLSMAHCVFYRCLMNGARTLEETDRRPLILCPVCRAKLCWNLDLDPVARYGGLAEAMEAAGLEDEARRARAAADVTRRHERP